MHDKNRYSYKSTYVHTPFELRTPTGLGAFLRSSTLKSMGISLEDGGLYSCSI